MKDQCIVYAIIVVIVLIIVVVTASCFAGRRRADHFASASAAPLAVGAQVSYVLPCVGGQAYGATSNVAIFVFSGAVNAVNSDNTMTVSWASFTVNGITTIINGVPELGGSPGNPPVFGTFIGLPATFTPFDLGQTLQWGAVEVWDSAGTRRGYLRVNVSPQYPDRKSVV